MAFNLENTSSTYYQRAALIFYYIAVVGFSVCLFLNQPDYFKNKHYFLILTDFISLLLIGIGFVLFTKKKVSLKVNSAIYVYTTLLNLGISTWFYFDKNVFFTGNFLFGTFIYCINVVVAGFCVGHRHAYFAAALYVALFVPLIFISGDTFLAKNFVALPFLIVAFASGVSAFLYVLEQSHKEELILKEELFGKDKVLAEERNKMLAFELECKQKEIVAKTMFLLEFSENNKAIVKKLNNIKRNLKPGDIKTINEINEQLNGNNREKYWKEFETSYLEVNPEFYKKLQLKCPDLSPSELKLAALIHLGLSSKQIGSLNASTSESVDVARSRLRAKLNLSTETNLRLFLLSI